MVVSKALWGFGTGINTSLILRSHWPLLLVEIVKGFVISRILCWKFFRFWEFQSKTENDFSSNYEDLNLKTQASKCGRARKKGRLLGVVWNYYSGICDLFRNIESLCQNWTYSLYVVLLAVRNVNVTVNVGMCFKWFEIIIWMISILYKSNDICFR